MDRNKLNAILAAVIATVAEMGEEGAPSGVLYAGLMGQGVNYDAYVQIIELLKVSGLVTERGHVVRATAKGAELAREIEAKCGKPKEKSA